MKPLSFALAMLAAAGSVIVSEQAPATLRSAEPFKLGARFSSTNGRRLASCFATP